MTGQMIAHAALPANVTGHRATGWWGMALFILTEATLFAALVASYFYVRAGAAVWPPAGIAAPDLTLPIPMTALLLGSSLPMWWADTGIARGDERRLKLGLALSFLLALAFICLQAVEYSRKPFTPQTNVYGSLFFVITGLHGAHVAIALLINAVTQVRAWLGHFTAARRLAVQNTALYWHFVDAVWIVIFASLYLVPHL